MSVEAKPESLHLSIAKISQAVQENSMVEWTNQIPKPQHTESGSI
jgi:hypothetical protein